MIYKDQNMNIAQLLGEKKCTKMHNAYIFMCSMNKSEQNFMVFSVEILVELIKMGRSE